MYSYYFCRLKYIIDNKMKRIIKSREDALAAFRKAKERKRQWEQSIDKKLAELEQEMIACESGTES